MVTRTTDWSLVAPRIRVGGIEIYESHCGHRGGTSGDQSDCEEKRLEHVSSPGLVAGSSLVRSVDQLRPNKRKVVAPPPV